MKIKKEREREVEKEIEKQAGGERKEESNVVPVQMDPL